MSFVTGLVILVLSLAIWLFFSLESMRLDAASTSVVVLVCTVVVLSAKWLWLHFHRKKVRR